MKIAKSIKIVITMLAFVIAMSITLTACTPTEIVIITPDGATYAAVVHMRREVGSLEGKKLSYLPPEQESNIAAAMTSG